jgi:hypothetical protein
VREAAKWILAKGGKCTISSGNTTTEVNSEPELPAGKFELVGFLLDRRAATSPLKDSEFRILRDIKTLRSVWLYSMGLSDDAFRFLNDNEELTSVALHSDLLTDGVLAHLASARNLTELTLVYSPNFTGKDLGRMSWLPGLTNANFASSGISDKGLRALLAAKTLRKLNLSGGNMTATDAGLASIAGHPALSELSLEAYPGFSDKGFAALAKLRTLHVLHAAGTGFGNAAAAAFAGHRKLEELNLRETPLTDSGLAKLTSLKTLLSLVLTGSKVTATGIANFKKASPNCVVAE